MCCQESSYIRCYSWFYLFLKFDSFKEGTNISQNLRSLREADFRKNFFVWNCLFKEYFYFVTFSLLSILQNESWSFQGRKAFKTKFYPDIFHSLPGIQDTRAGRASPKPPLIFQKRDIMVTLPLVCSWEEVAGTALKYCSSHSCT